MSDVVKNRELVQNEETQRNAGVTEQLGKKLGGIANFLMIDGMYRQDYKANGPYGAGIGTDIDGLVVFPSKVEIVLVIMSNNLAGASGTTEFDLTWYDAPGSPMGSIFSTTPKIDSTASNDAYIVTDIITATDHVTVTGGTNPVATKTTFEAYEAIKCTLVDAMVGATNSQLNVFYRPIT